jgi:hypothetical protein
MMNRRRAKYLIGCSILLCGWAARPSQTVQQSAKPAPSAAPVAPRDPTAARFSFQGDAAQIPAVFLRNLIFMPVRVNGGKPVLLELDSAAEKSAIDRKVAGDTASNALQYAVLALPGVQVPFLTLPVISREDFAQQVGQPYQGTLGRDFFDRVVVERLYLQRTRKELSPDVCGAGAAAPREI